MKFYVYVSVGVLIKWRIKFYDFTIIIKQAKDKENILINNIIKK